MSFWNKTTMPCSSVPPQNPSSIARFGLKDKYWRKCTNSVSELITSTSWPGMWAPTSGKHKMSGFPYWNCTTTAHKNLNKWHTPHMLHWTVKISVLEQSEATYKLIQSQLTACAAASARRYWKSPLFCNCITINGSLKIVLFMHIKS